MVIVRDGFLAAANFFAPFYGFGDTEVVRVVNCATELELSHEIALPGGFEGIWKASDSGFGNEPVGCWKGGADQMLISNGDVEHCAASGHEEPFVAIGREKVGIDG